MKALSENLRTLAVVAPLFITITLAMFFGFSRYSDSTLIDQLGTQDLANAVKALDLAGIEHRVENTGILVKNLDRSRARVVLASNGIPGRHSAGYELLDEINGFSSSRQQFNATLHRALEGEIERLISSMQAVREAHVIVSMDQSSTWSRSSPQSATVSVDFLRSPPSNALLNSIQMIVSSSVQGMEAESVTVVDHRTGKLLSAPGSSIEFSENDRADLLKLKIDRLLEAQLGANSYTAEVRIELAHESEVIRERNIIPDSRVEISSHSVEEKQNQTDGGPEATTVASNLPDTSNSDSEGTVVSEQNSKENNTEFDYSHSTREFSRAPGDIRRISVAVQIDENHPILAEQEDPSVYLDKIRGLVSAAVGLNEDRGDTIAVESLPFTMDANTAIDFVPETDAVDPFLRYGAIALAASLLLAILAAVLFARSRSNAAKASANTSPNEQNLPALNTDLSEASDGLNLDHPDSAVMPGANQELLDPASILPQKENELEQLISSTNEEIERVQSVLREWIESPSSATSSY